MFETPEECPACGSPSVQSLALVTVSPAVYGTGEEVESLFDPEYADYHREWWRCCDCDYSAIDVAAFVADTVSSSSASRGCCIVSGAARQIGRKAIGAQEDVISSATSCPASLTELAAMTEALAPSDDDVTLLAAVLDCPAGPAVAWLEETVAMLRAYPSPGDLAEVLGRLVLVHAAWAVAAVPVRR